MKLKKALTLLLSTALFLSMAIAPAKAAVIDPRGPGQGPHPAQWDVLVLVLPNTSLSYSANQPQKYVTTIKPTEVQKITNLANKLQDFSTGNMQLNVTVKVDNQAITSTTFGYGIGRVVLPENINDQIKRNSTLNQYDSILVVYRNNDGTVNLGTNSVYTGKVPEANNSSYSVFPLKDSDHSLSQLSTPGAEQLLLTELLESVYAEMHKTNASLAGVPRVYDPANSGKSRNVFMNYMNSTTNGSIGGSWKEFVAPR